MKSKPENEKVNESIISELEELKKVVTGTNFQQYPPIIQNSLENLKENDVGHALIGKIGEKLLDKWRITYSDSEPEQMSNWTKAALVDELSSFDYSGISYEKKFISLVGPTGVGKTTTLAKLAAKATLEQKKKIAFITFDTYRIAAIEQLKTYAELLHVPVEVVYNHEDFVQAAKKLADYDTVFIDTAGRNYKELLYINELEKMFGNKEEMETYLVLSLSMKEKDIRKIVDNFKEMKINKFIFTKIDETDTYGTMMNLICDYQIGAAYITTGQDVPDDITFATPTKIADYLLKDETL